MTLLITPPALFPGWGFPPPPRGRADRRAGGRGAVAGPRITAPDTEVENQETITFTLTTAPGFPTSWGTISPTNNTHTLTITDSTPSPGTPGPSPSPSPSPAAPGSSSASGSNPRGASLLLPPPTP